MKRRLEVFGASPEAIQIVWRGRGNGHGTLELSGQRAELSTDHDIGAHTFTGLAPATTYDIALDGRRVATARTLPRPAGRRLGTVATISDLHVGEIGTGHLPRVSSQHARSAWPSAHPVWCLEAAVEALNDWHPDLVVAKGDLSHGNLPEEYDVVAKLLLDLAGIAAKQFDGTGKVGLLDQPAKQRPAGLAVEVAGDTALARRVRGPVQRTMGLLNRIVERADGAGRRPGRRFDLDHVGAELREHAAGQQAAMVGQVEDAVGSEESGRLGHVRWSFIDEGADCASIGPRRERHRRRGCSAITDARARRIPASAQRSIPSSPERYTTRRCPTPTSSIKVNP